MKYTKLLLVSPTFYPTHGGAELRFLRYLPLLKENGIEVTVITGTPKRKKFSEKDHSAKWRNKENGVLVSEIEINSSKIFQYKLPEKGAAERSRILLDRVIEFCRNSDTRPHVVQILSTIPLKMVGKLQEIKSIGIPIVFSYSIAHEFSNNLLIEWAQRKKIRHVFKNFDCIIAASSVLENLIKKIEPNAYVKIIANGVDVKKFSPVANKHELEQLRLKLGMPKNAQIICSVGAIHPRKGTDLLVKAWSKIVREHSDLHLMLIGPRYDQEREELKDFKDEIEAAIIKSGHMTKIHFMGQVENVDEYLKTADMFVFPSQKEGMPNAVLEAMATGLPTIVTPFVGLSDDLGKAGREYILVDRTLESILAGIQNLINNESQKKALKKCARKWIVNTMDLNESVAKHADVYNSFANKNLHLLK